MKKIDRLTSEIRPKGKPSDFPFWFRWKVFQAGYEWRDDVFPASRDFEILAGTEKKSDRDLPGPFMVPADFMESLQVSEPEEGNLEITFDIEAERPMMLYHPLHLYPGLHRQFSDLDGSREAVISFADSYGMLGIGMAAALRIRGVSAPIMGAVCESLYQWQREIKAMHRLVTLWDALSMKDANFLNRHVYWDENHVYWLDASDEYLEAHRRALNYRKRGEERLISRFVKYPEGENMPAGFYTIADLRIDPEIFRELKSEWNQRKSPFSAARLHFQKMLNDELKKQDINLVIMPQATASSPPGAYRGHYVPTSLLAAMYLQLWFEGTGQKVIRTCKREGCSNYVEQENPRGRPQEYCSKSCRTKASYYKNKDKTIARNSEYQKRKRQEGR